MWIPPDLSWTVLEPQLLKSLEKVDWIGELPIEPDDFDNIGIILRRGFTSGGKPEIDKVKPATFVTSMVFAARYSREHARNFWTPYAIQVWGLREATQYFQKICRSHFSSCTRYLRAQLGLSFPRMYSGDVVRPIYRHAIIPFHLEGEFADWLKSKHVEIADLGEAAARVLRDDPSVNYLSPTLRTFLQSDETAETAQALIRDMATAADLYLNEGETEENISALLDYSPIRQMLWKQLHKTLDEHRPRQIQRTAGRAFSTQVEWIWSFAHEDLVLRLRGLALESESRPSHMVWVEEKDPLRSRLFEYVYPYSQGQGRWLIDEVILPPDEEETPGLRGNLVLVGEDQSALESLSVPGLEVKPFMLFRLTQQQAYGIELNYRDKPITDGLWAISMAINVLLIDEEGREVTPLQELSVPSTLMKRGHHTQAGIYDLHLPITVKIGDQSLPLEHQAQGVSSSTLEGVGYVEGLSPSVPPAFTDRHIELKLFGGSRRLIELGRLLMKTKSAPTRSWSLKKLEDDGQLSLLKDTILVDLEPLLPDGPALIVIEVFQGLHSAFPSPIQIALLTGIRIVPPNLNTIFSPNLLPSAWISGITSEQIVEDPCLESRIDGDGLRLTWNDLRQPSTVRLQLGEDAIVLTWDPDRVYAWLEPDFGPGGATIEEMASATLHLRSPRGNRQGLLWIEGAAAKRQIDLGARGHYHQRVREDPLYDMILGHHASSVVVWTELAGQTFKIVEILRTPEICNPKTGYDVSAETFTFLCDIEFEWVGKFVFHAYTLADPDAEPITLGRAEGLRSQQIFPCKLTAGLYLLEILRDGVPLTISQGPLLIPVGKEQESHLEASTALLDYLTGSQMRVPGPLGPEFLREVAGQPRIEPLSGIRLYQLATMPGSSCTALASEQLRQLWTPLSRVAYAQNMTAWTSGQIRKVLGEGGIVEEKGEKGCSRSARKTG